MTDVEKTKEQLIEELAELRQSLDALVNNLPEGFAIVDPPDAKVRLASRYCQQMFGASKEEMESIRGDEHFRYYQMCHPNGVPARFEQLPLFRVLAVGEVIRNEEWLFQMRDGRKIPVVCHSGPVRDQQGTITGAVISWHDITKRKQAEEALRQNERRLTTLMSNLPGMAYRCKNDSNWTIEFISDGCIPLTGYSPSAFIGNHNLAYADIIHPDDREQVWEDVQQAITEGRHFQLEYRIRTASGEEKWIWEQGIAIYTDNGQVEALEGLMTDITERKQAEEALKQSHEELEHRVKERTSELMEANNDLAIHRLFADAATQGFGIADLDGYIRYVNAAMCRILGEDKIEDVIGRQYFSYGRSIEYMKDDFLPVFLRDGQLEKEDLLRTSQGKLVPVWYNSFLIRDNEGQPAYIATVLSDITERKQAEEALRQSHDELQAIYEGMVDGLNIVDVETKRFVKVNATFCRMLGYSEKELLSLSVMDIHPADSLPAVLKNFHALAAEQLAISENTPVLRKDGSVFYADIGAKMMFYKGRLTGIGFFHDITERKQAEEALRQSEERFRTLVEASPDGVLMADLQGRVTFASRRVLELYGSDNNEDIFGKDPLTFIAPNSHQKYITALHRTLEAGVTRNLEVILVRKDGTQYPAELSATVIKGSSGEPVALSALMRDITERKRAEEALHREHCTLKYLLQSSDHERQTIAYEIHDGLAQYLAAAIMQFDVYKGHREKRPNEATKAYDAAITLLCQGHSEARRLIAGIRHPVLDEAGVVEAVAHLINEQNRKKEQQIEFHSLVNFSRLVPLLENAIYRIIQEGMTNACKYSQSDRVRITLLQQKDRLRIEIRDWGIGFNPNNVPEGSYGLTGIRERARLLGGKYRLQSAAGKGTRIVIELPLMERES